MKPILLLLCITVLSVEASAKMSAVILQRDSLKYTDAFHYVAAWAVFDHDDVSDMSRNPKDFHGHLGSLDFSYSDEDHVLHVWAFVMPGAGPFVTRRPEVKYALDHIAQQQPVETNGAIFDIRTLDWNKQVASDLEPCLWLRLDMTDASTTVSDMVKRLNDLSTTGYMWHRQKMNQVLDAYWKAHPRSAK